MRRPGPDIWLWAPSCSSLMIQVKVTFNISHLKELAFDHSISPYESIMQETITRESNTFYQVLFISEYILTRKNKKSHIANFKFKEILRNFN